MGESGKPILMAREHEASGGVTLEDIGLSEPLGVEPEMFVTRIMFYWKAAG